MNKAFSNFTWENEPSVNTPISANNLNKVNNALNEIDNRVLTHETTKANKTDVQNAITGVSLDEDTGIFTFTRENGTTVTIDTRLEKVIMNWNFDSTTQTLYLILQDGTEMPVDLSAFITNVDFKDSTTIRVVLNDDGTVSFEIIDGTITADKLEPNYLANVQVASESASKSAESAEESALRAEAAADRAESVSDVGIATTEVAGIVKPDGVTITITSDGTISAQTSGGGGITEEELNDALANYLPLTGGNIDGRLGVESTEAVSRVFSVKNSVKGIAVHVNPQGQAGLWDGANVKWAIVSDIDGNVTVNGIATGNAKVVASGSAPSDTISIWVDTTNKKIKYYIDGAWTVV